MGRRMDESHIMTNHQDTSTERERFEVWITPKLKAGSHLNKSASGIYLDNRVAAKWSAWQAALASRDEAAQQPQGQAVSDAGDEAAHECLSVLAGIDTYEVNLCDHPDAYKALDGYTRAILALRDKPATSPDGTPNNAI